MATTKIKEEDKVFDILLKVNGFDKSWAFICPYCHHELFDLGREGTIYCPYCGTKISLELKGEKK